METEYSDGEEEKNDFIFEENEILHYDDEFLLWITTHIWITINLIKMVLINVVDEYQIHVESTISGRDIFERPVFFGCCIQ